MAHKIVTGYITYNSYTTNMFSTLNRIVSRINSALIEAPPLVPLGGEILFNNQIENDLVSVLRPLNLMQALFICSKYKIGNKSIMPNSLTYNFIGITYVLIYRSYVFYDWICTFDGFGKGFYVLLNWSAINDNFFLSFGFLLMYLSNIKYSNKNVLLVSRIQHALTLLKMNSRELRYLKIYNWISVMIINSTVIVTLTFYFYFFPETNYMFVLSSYNIIFDINVMYASFLVKLLCKLLVVWNEDVRSAEHISDLERESYWKIKYDVYVDIMDAYKLIDKTFDKLIVFNIVSALSHGLIHIATLLQIQILIPSTVVFSLVIVVSQIWLIKSILVGVSLSVSCERFYEAVNNVQDALIPLMFSIRSSDEHMLSVCKNIQRIKSASFKKLNLCGLFVVDAEMSLRLFSFMTTYTIVLVQFRFL